MVALQTKVDNYEREIQQWKKALKRADDYIEELNSEMEKYKNNISADGVMEKRDSNDTTQPLPGESYKLPTSSTGENIKNKEKCYVSGFERK